MVVTVSFREIKLGGCIVSLNCFYECACNRKLDPRNYILLSLKNPIMNFLISSMDSGADLGFTRGRGEGGWHFQKMLSTFF